MYQWTSIRSVADFSSDEMETRGRGMTYSVFCSVTQSCVTLCNPMGCSTPGFPVLQHLLELAQTHVHWVGDAIQSNHLTSVIHFSSCLLSLPASGSFPISCLFASVSQSIGASASVLPINIQGWFLLGLTRFDLLAVQGTVKSLLQHHNSKASILQCSVFFMIQLSHQYMTTRNTTSMTIWTFVGKVMSLLFNTLSRFGIALLPRSKHLLISWLQSHSVVILEPKKIKSCHCSYISPHLFAMKWWDWNPWS